MEREKLGIEHYTPGPWTAKGTHITAEAWAGANTAPWHLECYDGHLVAESIFNPANAALIAAAPMMYEVLKTFPGFVEDCPPWAELKDKAIAKAEGR